MKKLKYWVSVGILCILLTACGSKKVLSFDEESWDFTNIEVRIGSTGMARTISDEETDELFDILEELEFEKQKSNDSDGWRFSIEISNGSTKLDTIAIVSEDTIIYQKDLYKAANGTINLDYFQSLFCIESKYKDVNTLEGLVLSTEEPVYANSIDTIKLIFENELPKEFVFGEEVILEIEEDGEWYQVIPSSELAWNAIGIILAANSTVEDTIYLTAFNNYLEDGHYRFIKNVYMQEEDKTTPYVVAAEFNVGNTDGKLGTSGDIDVTIFTPTTDSLTDEGGMLVKKPVIYLYPQKEMDVNVSLDLDGEFVFTYPEYNEGWEVTASPDGRLINHKDGLEYSYLFWEGITDATYDMSEGFVVAGKDTMKFLQEKLSYLGLTPKEYNEFIVFWLPLMQENPYNLITFQGEAYTDSAKLHVSPQPDSVLRVFMVYQPLNEWIDIKEQKLSTFERTGFSVIEWGGAEIE